MSISTSSQCLTKSQDFDLKQSYRNHISKILRIINQKNTYLDTEEKQVSMMQSYKKIRNSSKLFRQRETQEERISHDRKMIGTISKIRTRKAFPLNQSRITR